MVRKNLDNAIELLLIAKNRIDKLKTKGDYDTFELDTIECCVGDAMGIIMKENTDIR